MKVCFLLFYLFIWILSFVESVLLPLFLRSLLLFAFIVIICVHCYYLRSLLLFFRCCCVNCYYLRSLLLFSRCLFILTSRIQSLSRASPSRRPSRTLASNNNRNASTTPKSYFSTLSWNWKLRKRMQKFASQIRPSSKASWMLSGILFTTSSMPLSRLVWLLFCCFVCLFVFRLVVGHSFSVYLFHFLLVLFGFYLFIISY
jgi:hypothetical protein